MAGAPAVFFYKIFLQFTYVNLVLKNNNVQLQKICKFTRK